jgi:hypothetical protein
MKNKNKSFSVFKIKETRKQIKETEEKGIYKEHELELINHSLNQKI